MSKFYKEDVWPVIVLILGVVAFCYVFWLLVLKDDGVSAAVQQTSTETFDHSNCQYPMRWSNPPDGCDNSDPAVPECVGKGQTEQQEKQCIDAFVKQNNDTQPTKTPNVAPASSHEQTAPKCTE